MSIYQHIFNCRLTKLPFALRARTRLARSTSKLQLTRLSLVAYLYVLAKKCTLCIRPHDRVSHVGIGFTADWSDGVCLLFTT